MVFLPRRRWCLVIFTCSSSCSWTPSRHSPWSTLAPLVVSSNLYVPPIGQLLPNLYPKRGPELQPRPSNCLDSSSISNSTCAQRTPHPKQAPPAAPISGDGGSTRPVAPAPNSKVIQPINKPHKHPGVLLPQGLCTCCSFCWKALPAPLCKNLLSCHLLSNKCSDRS